MMAFRIGNIPVRVHGSFFLITLLLAAGGDFNFARMAIWVVVVFASVLWHELGHAVCGRAFGLAPQIDLHGMGGTTSWESGRDVSTGRGILISLAGPIAGILVGTLALVLQRFGLTPRSELGLTAVRAIIWVNAGWGVLNLVPMLPLDGGNVMKGVLDWITGGKGEKPARYASIVIAALALVGSLMIQWTWTAMLSGLFAFRNIQALRQGSRVRVDAPLALAIDEAYQALDKQDGARAIEVLRPALSPEAAPELRQLAVRLYAYALLLEGQWAELLGLLETAREQIGLEEMARFETTARELGHVDEADKIRALASPPRFLTDFRA
jgi:Zn-dependent protease